MTVIVVDVLKIIQVDHGQGKGRAGVDERMNKTEHERPGDDARQRIVQRHGSGSFQLLLKEGIGG